MKKIFLIFLLFPVICFAQTDDAAELMGLGMPAALAAEVASQNSVLSDQTDYITLSSGALVPDTDDTIDIGSSTAEFQDGFFDGTLTCDAISNSGTLTQVGTSAFTGAITAAAATFTGVVDAGAATSIEIKNGTAIPATCSIGQLFHDTDSDDCADTPAGDGALCLCKAANTWAAVANI